MGKTGAVVLALIVGVAIGGLYFGLHGKGGGGHCGGPQQETPQTCLTPNYHNVNVAANGKPECLDVVIYSDDQITWFSPQGTNISVDIPGYNSNSWGNSARFIVPQIYTPLSTPTPIPFGIRVYNTGTPTPGPGTPTPQTTLNGRIIIMK
jgi:hypothetical protein